MTIPTVTPNILKRWFRELTWDVISEGNNIYLTFDDGPEPGTTPQVLAFLLKYNAKATFFCLGENAEKYPNLITQIKEQGHEIGNHGYQHLSGFTTKNKTYFENYSKGAAITLSKLYRPPYGRITPKQIKIISQHSKIVLWSIMSMDFNNKIAPAKCIQNVLNNAFNGAIVVFHDTQNASGVLLQSLPIILESLQKRGFNFKTLC